MSAEETLLEVRDLRVVYHGRKGDHEAVGGISLKISRGEVVALVGESGSGKTTTAHALIGLLPRKASITGGTVTFGGRDLSTLRERQWRSIRGAQIGLVSQDPAISLNPVRRIGAQISEVLRRHRGLDRRQAAVESVSILERVGIGDPAHRADQYPHELSGGMRQRVQIGLALACSPALLIADEPTSALDVTVQKRVLDQLAESTVASGTAVLLVTHDLAVAAERADRIIVMSQGVIVEDGSAEQITLRPAREYSRKLIADAPSLSGVRLIEDRPSSPEDGTRPIARLVHASKEFVMAGRRGRQSPTLAVDDVSLTLERGRTLALVGESGSGKTTTARLLLRLVEPTSGVVEFDGEDVTRLRGASLRSVRRRMQVVYQNPYASLDPRYSVRAIIEEPLDIFGIGTRAERRRRALELLDRVGLPARSAAARPEELSGGQRQRVAIARSLVLDPELLVLDEPVSALDVTVQGQILRLLAELQRERGLSYLLVSHDLAVVHQVSDTIGVMHRGKLVEIGPAQTILHRPRTRYAQELVDSVPGPRSTTGLTWAR